MAARRRIVALLVILWVLLILFAIVCIDTLVEQAFQRERKGNPWPRSSPKAH